MIQVIEIKNPFEPYFKEVRQEKFIACRTVKSYSPDADIFIISGEIIKEPTKRLVADGEQIIVMHHVGGGGLRKVLGFVASIALIAYSGNIAAGKWALGASKFFAAGHLGAILASGAVMYLGGRLINSVFPQKNPALNTGNQDTSQTYGWDLPSPVSAEGNVMGLTFGECIPQPQVLTQHVETVNGQQYLNLLLCGGMGPIDEIKNIRIGNNDIGNYTDVRLETRLGTNDQQPISFFNNNPIDQYVSLEVGDHPLIQTTNSIKASSIDLTFEWSGGLFKLDDNGSYINTTVKLGIYYRKKGDGNWINAGSKHLTGGSSNVVNLYVYPNAPVETWTLSRDYIDHWIGHSKHVINIYYRVTGSTSGDAGTVKAGGHFDNGKIRFDVIGKVQDINNNSSVKLYVEDSSFVVTAAQSASVIRTFSINNLVPTQYEVQVTMIDRDRSSRASTITRWEMLTSYEQGQYNRQDKVLVGMRILATNQLSGGVPSVNWRQVRNHVWVFNPDTNAYEQRSAKNPIWAAYDILHQCSLLRNINTGKDEFVADGINKDRLTKYWEQWTDAAAYADDMITNDTGEQEHRFEFDAFYDTADKRITQAQKAATVGHATILSHGNDIGIVVDKPGEICQIFGEGRTTASSVKGSFTSLAERAKEINVTYNDINNDFKNTQFLTRSLGWNQSDQDNTTDMTLFGVSRRSQAWREAIRALAINERQLQDIEFNADINAMVTEFGDIIGFNHAVSQIGVASGRIVSVTNNSVTIDKKVTILPDLTYEIIIQRYDDKIIKKAISTTDMTANVLELAEPFTADELPRQYDNYCIGESKKAVKPFRVINISRTGDQICDIKAVEYDEAVYSDSLDYSKYPVIDYTPPGTTADITNLSAAEETYMQRDGTMISNINVSWTLDRGTSADSFVVSTSDNGSTYQVVKTTADMHCTISNVKTNTMYYIRVYAVKDVVASKGQIVTVFITGKDSPPQDITKFYVVQAGEYLTASIVQNNDPDIKYYELRTGATWDNSTIVGTFTGDSYKFLAQSDGTQTFWIKAVDNSGNYALNAAKATVDVFGLPPKNVIMRSDEDLSEWTTTNMYLDAWGHLNAFSDSLPIGSLALFSDMFKPLSFTKTCIAYLPTIDLGQNIIDTSCFWTDAWGVMHIKSTETIGDYEHFSDMFGVDELTQVPIKYLASTFMSVRLNSNAGNDIIITQDYRTSVDGQLWSDWISTTHRQFYGRYLQIRITAQPTTGQKQLKIYGATVDVDVPDVDEIIQNIEIPITGKHIAFKQKFFTVPTSVALFTSDLQGKQATWQMSNLTANGVDIAILDDKGNNMIGMLIRADIRGY